jgi:DNA-binding CsgD family transcriptional regulator
MATTLGASDYRAGLALVRQLAAARSRDEFAHQGVVLLGRLVPSELTTLSVCDLAGGRRRVVSSPAGAISAADRAAFDRHFSEHPLVRHHTVEHGRDARRISDSMPFSRFRHTALYSDYYRRVGIDHVIAVPLHVDPRVLVSFVLNRSRLDFSDREQAQLDALAGTLGDLYRHTVALDRARAALHAMDGLLDSSSVGAIRVDARGSVRDFSPRAAAQVLRLWGVPLRRGNALPAPIGERLRHPLQCAAFALPPANLRRSALAVRTCPLADGGAMVLLDDEVPAEPTAAAWPLTARENEVLHWLAAGKTDRDIAAVLGISPRTVHKHLQRIYEKLGVETRTAAVMRWLRSR